MSLHNYGCWADINFMIQNSVLLLYHLNTIIVFNIFYNIYYVNFAMCFCHFQVWNIYIYSFNLVIFFLVIVLQYKGIYFS